MRTVQSVLIAMVLLASSAAFAQRTEIENRLSADEFRAAGLDKLSEAELARLNELLVRETIAPPAVAPAAPVGADVEARIAQAREEGRREARTEDLGKRAAPESRETIDSTIAGAFQGFARGREYALANGQVWRQVDNAALAGARGHDVAARIRPGLMGVWWLKVDGYNTQTRVERVR